MNDLKQLHEQLEFNRKSLQDVTDSLKRLSGRIKVPNSERENRERHDVKRDSKDHRPEPPNRASKVIRVNNSGHSSHKNGRSDSHQTGSDIKRIVEEPTERVLKRKTTDDEFSKPHAKRMSSGGGGGGGGAAAGGGSSGSGARKGSHDYEDDYADERNPSSRPLMKSSVISKNIKTRDDLIRLQNKFNGSEQRNRRMIGLLVGTLLDFKTDDKERSSTKQAHDRKELEKKIEVKKVEEEKRIAEEKRKLQHERYRNLRNIKIIEKKIQLTESFGEWRKTQAHLRNFIRTKAKPPIFYLPRVHRSDTKALLESSARLIDEQVEAKKKEIERELDVLTQESAALMDDETVSAAVTVAAAAAGEHGDEEAEENGDDAAASQQQKQQQQTVADDFDKEPDDVHFVEQDDADESNVSISQPPPPSQPQPEQVATPGDVTQSHSD